MAQQTVLLSMQLPEALHQRLVIAARKENEALSAYARRLLDRALAQKEQARIERTYQALAKVKGIYKEKVTDASSTINETLYGEKGAWKGQDE